MARVRVEVPVEKQHSQSVTEVQPLQNPKPGGLTVKKLAILLIVLVGIIFVGKLITDNNKLEQQVKSSVTSQDPSAIVEQLKKSIEIPEDETPQMRAISDASKFTEQNPSLADIKDGDILLFFARSQKVVVYRPSTHKAVVVVTLSQPTSETTQQNQ